MAFWVMIYHIKDAIDIPILSEIINRGYLGVDVFFVLSGYILTHVYYALLQKGFTKTDFIRFIQKRIARIYPLHLATMLGALLLTLFLNTFINPTTLYLNHIPYHLFMIHSWGFLGNARLNYPSWSISAEWFAYLIIFPSVAILFTKSYRTQIFTICVSLLTLFFVTYYFYQNDFGNELGFGIIRILPEFLMGCFFYDLRKRKKNKNLIFGAIVFISIGLVGAIQFQNLDFFLLTVAPLMIMLLHSSNTKIFEIFFGTKIPVFLGEISYSLYMTHFFGWKINGIIHSNFFGAEHNSIIYVVNYTIFTLIISILAYYFIEIPARKYINNLQLSNR